MGCGSCRFLIVSVVSMELGLPAAATAGCTRDGGSRSCPIRSSALRGGTVLCQMCSIPIFVVETTTFLHHEQKSHVCEHERFTHLEQKSSVDRNGNACLSSPLPRTLRGFMAKTERIMKTLFPKIHHMMRTIAVLLSSSCAHVPIIFQTILTFSETSKLHRIFWKKCHHILFFPLNHVGSATFRKCQNSMGKLC